MLTPKLPKLLLTSALTLAIHSPLHAASDIESGTPGTGQEASATVTSSYPTNTNTATGGSGAPNSSGGNANSSATLTPTADSTSNLTATGGNGGNSANVTPPGNGGNATLSSLSIINTDASNITLTAIAKGGNGGNESPLQHPLYNGGSATVNPISLSSLSGNITANITQTSGSGGTGSSSSFNGIAPDSTLTDIFSASTTGNITLTQSAFVGGGLPGNANSSLTFTNFSAASITAFANANANSNSTFTFFPPINTGISPSFGAANAYANITGTTDVIANAIAIAINSAAPASATAIAHAGPYPTNPVPGSTIARATATAGSGVSSSAYAASYTSNPYFSSVHVYDSTTSPGVPVTAGFFITSLPPDVIEAGFPLTSPITPTNNPNTKALLSAGIQYFPTGLQGLLQSFDAGFEGTLNTDLLPPEDLVIKVTPSVSNFAHLQLTILVDQNIQVSRSYTNLTFGSFGPPIYFDLGPLQSFGTDPLDLQVDLNATTNGPEALVTQVAAYDMDPALLTPEPTSSSSSPPPPSPSSSNAAVSITQLDFPKNAKNFCTLLDHNIGEKMPTPQLPKLKLLLTSAALTLTIHSTLHAASDIESGTPGTGQDASASVISSDSTNKVTANGGSGNTDGNGGNGTASAILTPISDSNSTITATGGVSGSNNISILPTIGGNANASASINASGNIILTLSATGGDGDTPSFESPLGEGGNSTVSASAIASGNISINASSQGGSGGGFATSPPLEGVGGTASIGTISAASTIGNITLIANDVGGNGNNGGAPVFLYGIGADASITNAFSASTSGNISLTQNASGGVGRVFGNANSSLTFTCPTANSITANVNANPNISITSNNSLLASNGTANAYADITGNANVVATAHAIAGNSAAPASATAIVHAGPYPGFILGSTFAKATAIAQSNTATPVYAAAYTSDQYFSSANVFASSNFSGQGVSAGFFASNPTLGVSTIQGALPLTSPVSPTNDPNTKALIATTIQSVDNASPGRSYTFSSGFEGLLDPSALPEQDLVLKLPSAGYFFHILQLTVMVNQNTVFNESYTNQTFVPLGKSLFYDLGSLASFGNSPLDIKFELDVTLLNTSEDLLPTVVGIYDMNPALLTPEPTSFSLLAAATLPLLLKRRRKI